MMDRSGRQRRINHERVKVLLEYATEQYGCLFPRNFAMTLSNVAYMQRIPRKQVVDAIYKEWKVWEPYLEEDSYCLFFQNELKTMFRLQTTSTFSSPVLNGYIGNKATLKEEAELPLLTTTVMWKGNLIKDGKEI